MLSSNIIKGHSVHPRKIMIGLMLPKGRTLAAARSPRVNGKSAPGGLDGGEGAPDLASPTMAWTPEAEEVLARARVEAEAIVKEARNKAEDICTKAYEKGFEKGRADGLARATAEMQTDVRRISELARNAAADAATLYNNSEEGLVELALSIAEKVIYKHLAEDRSLVLSMVKGVLQQLDATSVTRVRVNPEDLEYLQPHWEEAGLVPGGRSVELAADPRVQVGGCVIDTDNSVVDAQLKTRLAEIQKAFDGEMSAHAR